MEKNKVFIIVPQNEITAVVTKIGQKMTQEFIDTMLKHDNPERHFLVLVTIGSEYNTRITEHLNLFHALGALNAFDERNSFMGCEITLASSFLNGQYKLPPLKVFRMVTEFEKDCCSVPHDFYLLEKGEYVHYTYPTCADHLIVRKKSLFHHFRKEFDYYVTVGTRMQYFQEGLGRFVNSHSDSPELITVLNELYLKLK